MKWYNIILITLIIGGIMVLLGQYSICVERARTEIIVDKLVNLIERKIDETNVIGPQPITLDTKPITLDTKPIVQEQWENVNMDVSAYCPCEKCCGRFSDGITASGKKIKVGDVFVAAPKQYKFGTEMKIPGYNNGETVRVEDVGSAIKGNKLDVFFHTHQEALNWGRQYLSVQVRRM